MLTQYLIVFFVAMVPLIELRGAIPIAEAMNLPFVQYYIIAIIGNMLPVPIIYFFARKVLIWGADKPVIGKFFSWCLEKGERGGKKLQEKAGRGLKAIPDFVFFPKGEKHFASAPMVIEAKLDMSSIAEQRNAFSQGLSYARMLRSSIMGICDKERLILYRVNKNGIADRNSPLFEEHWLSIYGDAEVGVKLNQLIGREVIAKM